MLTGKTKNNIENITSHYSKMSERWLTVWYVLLTFTDYSLYYFWTFVTILIFDITNCNLYEKKIDKFWLWSTGGCYVGYLNDKKQTCPDLAIYWCRICLLISVAGQRISVWPEQRRFFLSIWLRISFMQIIHGGQWNWVQISLALSKTFTIVGKYIIYYVII